MIIKAKISAIFVFFYLLQFYMVKSGLNELAKECSSPTTYTPIMTFIYRTNIDQAGQGHVTPLSDGNVLYHYLAMSFLTSSLREFIVQKFTPDFKVLWTITRPHYNISQPYKTESNICAMEDVSTNSIFLMIIYIENHIKFLEVIQIKTATGEEMAFQRISVDYDDFKQVYDCSAYMKSDNGLHYLFLTQIRKMDAKHPLILYYNPKNLSEYYFSKNFARDIYDLGFIYTAVKNTNGNIVLSVSLPNRTNRIIQVKQNGPDSWQLLNSADNTYQVAAAYINMYGKEGIAETDTNFFKISFDDPVPPSNEVVYSNLVALYSTQIHKEASMPFSKDLKTYLDAITFPNYWYKFKIFDTSTHCYYKTTRDTVLDYVFSIYDAKTSMVNDNNFYFFIVEFKGRLVFLKISLEGALSCPPNQYNYFHQACYDSTTDSCHPACKNLCLTSGNSNAFAYSTEHCILDVYSMNPQYKGLDYIFRAIPDNQGFIYNTTDSLKVTDLLDKNCHPNCGGFCQKINDPMKCTRYCLGDPLIDNSKMYYGYCPCKASAKLSAVSSRCVSNTGCSITCANNECGEDPTNCISCKKDIPHLISIPSDNFYYKCNCDTDWTLNDGQCICTACYEGCEPAKCTSPRDAQKCTKCKAGYRGINQPDGITLYCYKCAENESDDMNGHCSPGYSTNCHPFCNGNCLKQQDQTACFSCINRLNLETRSSSQYTVKCACKSGTVQFGINNLCIYQTNCHPYCIEGCTVTKSLYHCASALTNGVCSFNSANLDYTCTGCSPGTSLTASGCSKILYSNCDPHCTAAGCTKINDPAACVECFQDRTLTTNGKTYCGPCQFNDVTVCMKFDGICWNSYKHPLETANLSSYDCASLLAKTCYPIWKQQGEYDMQCRDYLKTFNLTLLEAIPKAISAKHVNASDGANVVVTFDMDVNTGNIHDCAIMLSPDTIAKLGQTYSCKWLSPREYSIIYSPQYGYLTNLTLRGNTVFSAFPYALFTMDTTTVQVENKIEIKFKGKLYAPLTTLPSKGLTLTMTVSPTCGVTWSYAWHFSYIIGGPSAQFERQAVDDYFSKYATKNEKTMVITIPPEILFKNSLLKVTANAFSAIIGNPIVDDAFVVILKDLTEEEVFFDLNSKTAITQNLPSRKKNRFNVPLLWNNISSIYSIFRDSLYMTFGRKSNVSVSIEVKSGNESNQITTRGEHELTIEKTLLENYIQYGSFNFPASSGSSNTSFFKSYVYYNITMTVRSKYRGGNSSSTTDSMIAFFTRQSPVCKITTSYFILSPYTDNELLSTESEIDYGYGDEVSYFWTCESCEILTSVSGSCPCDVFSLPGDRRKHITTIKASSMQDFCKYVFSLSITVKNNKFVRSCYSTKEIVTMHLASSELKSYSIPSSGGTTSGSSDLYLGAEFQNPSLLEGIKSYTWNLLEVEKKINNQNTAKYSTMSQFFDNLFQDSLNIASKRWLTESKYKVIPQEYIPKVIDTFQTIPPMLGISKTSLPPDTSFTYVLNITYNDSNKKSAYAEVSFKTSSDASPRELLINPENGTEYYTKFLFTFAPISNIKESEEAEFQLLRKECPNSASDASNDYIPFTLRLRNIYAFSTILSGGSSNCGYQVGIKLKIFNGDREYVSNNCYIIRIVNIYSEMNERKEYINTVLKALEDNEDSDQSITKIMSYLHQISYNSTLLTLQSLTKLLTILTKYDSEIINTLFDLFTKEEQLSFIEICIQIITNIARGGSKIITEPILSTLVEKVANYTTMMKYLSSYGMTLFPTVVSALSAIASYKNTAILSKKSAGKMISIINLLTETKIKEIIPNSRAYQINSSNINISISSFPYSSAKQIDLNHSVPENQTVFLPSKIIANFVSNTSSKPLTITSVLISTAFNPYEEIKRNTIISNTSLTNISLAQGKIPPETISEIYSDWRNYSGKKQFITDTTLIYSNILSVSLYATTYSRVRGQEIINITIPTLLSSQDILASISLLSSTLLPLDNTIIIPIYYNGKKQIWTNYQCDIDPNKTLVNSSIATSLPYSDQNEKKRSNKTYILNNIKLHCANYSAIQVAQAGSSVFIFAVDEIPDIDNVLKLRNNLGNVEKEKEEIIGAQVTAIAICFTFVLFGLFGSLIIIRYEKLENYNLRLKAITARYNRKEIPSSPKVLSTALPSPRSLSPRLTSPKTVTTESCLKQLAKFSSDTREKGYSNIEPLVQAATESLPTQRKSSGITEEGSPTERRIVSFKDFPCFPDRDLTENEENELMTIYKNLNPTKNQVKITREALVKEITTSIPLQYISTKFAEEKNDLLRSSISGLFITEYAWLSLVLIYSVLSHRAVRYLTILSVYLGELFITGAFFKGDDSVYISEDSNDFAQTAFKAIAVSISSMVGLKLLFQFFLVSKHPCNCSEKSSVYKNNRMRFIIGIIILIGWVFICIWRILACSIDYERIAFEKWLWTYLICFGFELLVVDAIKIGLKLLFNYLFMKIAQKAILQFLHRGFIVRAINAIYYYFP